MSTYVSTGVELMPIVNAIQLAMVLNMERAVRMPGGVCRIPVDDRWEILSNQSKHFRKAVKYGLPDGDLLPESAVVLDDGIPVGMLHRASQVLAWATPIQEAVEFAAVVAYQFSDSVLKMDTSLQVVQ
jgi:hypothetical protein